VFAAAVTKYSVFKGRRASGFFVPQAAFWGKPGGQAVDFLWINCRRDVTGAACAVVKKSATKSARGVA
jgi:hypothetical protein